MVASVTLTPSYKFKCIINAQPHMTIFNKHKTCPPLKYWTTFHCHCLKYLRVVAGAEVMNWWPVVGLQLLLLVFFFSLFALCSFCYVYCFKLVVLL